MAFGSNPNGQFELSCLTNDREEDFVRDRSGSIQYGSRDEVDDVASEEVDVADVVLSFSDPFKENRL